jgi:hypothetical protein
MPPINIPFDLKEKLSTIDKAILLQAKEIKQLSDQLTFIHITDFELSEDTPIICNNSFDRNGIYFFEIKNAGTLDKAQWIEEFNLLWNIQHLKEVIWFPGIKLRRVRAHTSFSEWIPFYIGKSIYVGRRINEHIHQSGLQHTFSMKLKARQNLRGWQFRVSWIPLDVHNYEMIAPAIESALRDKLNPIIGKQ